VQTLFVGGALGAIPPSARGVRCIPLDALAQDRLGHGPDLRPLEAEAQAAVAGDLGRLVELLAASPSLRGWLHAGGADLTSAQARPEGLAIGFPAQWLAWRVASEQALDGPVATWGASAFQNHGVAAAVGRAVPELGPAIEQGPVSASPVRLEAAQRRDETCDVLYLALEPHVARQQDRLLSILAARHRVRVAVPLSRPWPWPDETRFRPESVQALRGWLRARDFARLGGRLAARVVATRGRMPRIAWMPEGATARHVRATWLRAAHIATAVTRAIAGCRPRLLLGTNLASGIGAVIAQAAAAAGVQVVGLPSGADYLLPPVFAPESTAHAHIVVPGESVRALLVAAGGDPRRLVACGWPELDDLVTTPRLERSVLMKRAGLAPDRRLVVFFSSPSTGAEALVAPAAGKREAFQALADACEAAGAALVVKRHPRERDDTLDRAAAVRSVPVPVVGDDLASWLAAADVVTSLGSAVGFAAATLGKPVLVLGFGAMSSLSSPSAALGIGEAPSAPRELPDALRRALAGGHRPHADLLGADGQTCRRIAALIDRLIG
jgi:hypothetical protein